jgi:hypothetical protein
MKTRGLVTLLAVAALLALAVGADAAPIVTYSYATDAPSYGVAPGQTFTIKVFLNEALTGGATSIEAANGGVVGAGFYVTETGPFPSNGTVITAINGNPAPNDPAHPGRPGDGFNGGSGATISAHVASNGLSASLLEGTNDFPGPVGAPTSFGTQLLLGTVTFRAGAMGTNTRFILDSFANTPVGPLGGSGQNGNTVDYGFNDYDVGGIDPTTGQAFVGANQHSFEIFQVTGVPEPASLLTFALASASGVALGAWRRRRERMAAKV